MCKWNKTDLVDILDLIMKYCFNRCEITELREYIRNNAEKNNMYYIYGINSGEIAYYNFYQFCFAVINDILFNNITKKTCLDNINMYLRNYGLLVCNDCVDKKDFAKNIVSIEKKLVYFDNNFFINYKRNKYLINSSKFQFIYSPAHLEELANSSKDKADDNEYIKADINVLNNMTDCICFLPDAQVGVKVYREKADYSYTRVI